MFGRSLNSGSAVKPVYAFGLCLANCADHVERAFRIILEFIVQDALAAIERVIEADELAFEAGELLGREEGLGQKPLQPSCARDDRAVLRRKLLKTQHGDDVFQIAYWASVRRISCAKA